MEGLSPRATLVFDMDGVLVDVTASYRETIRETVRHYTGQDVSNDLIQTYKNKGGWNNDWSLSQRLIADIGALDVPYDEVVTYFQSVFFGTNGREGLIRRERWLPANGLLKRLKTAYRLAIFTGRLRVEAAVTLRRFVPGFEWDAIVGDDDVTEKKPHPEGLFHIRTFYPSEPMWYVGDTVDDAHAAAAAEVPFIGIVHTHNPRRDEVVHLLEANGARTVLEDINEIEEFLGANG